MYVTGTEEYEQELRERKALREQETQTRRFSRTTPVTNCLYARSIRNKIHNCYDGRFRGITNNTWYTLQHGISFARLASQIFPHSYFLARTITISLSFSAEIRQKLYNPESLKQ